MYSYALTKMTIKEKEYAVCFGLDSNRKMDTFSLSAIDNDIQINNIYTAKIEKVIPGIQAAFVRISKDQTCYLPFQEAENPIYSYKQSKKLGLCVGDEILVQIKKEAIKTKEPQVSCNLSLQSNYFVLTTEQKTFSVSHKIDAENKIRIENIYKKLLVEENISSANEYGIVARTIAGAVESSELVLDLKNLICRFHKLMEEGIHKNAYSLVYEETPRIIHFLKNQNLSSESCILTDDDDLFDLVSNEIPSYEPYLRKYSDEKVSLKTLYNLRGNIDSLLKNQIWLKSGGNIIIEQLETMTVIDVNSAKSNPGKDVAYAINLEALEEILLQLRLRNISGMILIDFINMDEANTERFISLLKGKIKEDSIPVRFHDITKLGIVELTRKKIEKSVKEILDYRK